MWNITTYTEDVTDIMYGQQSEQAMYNAWQNTNNAHQSQV